MRMPLLLLTFLACLVISGRAAAQTVRAGFIGTASSWTAAYHGDDGDYGDDGDDEHDEHEGDDEDSGDHDAADDDEISSSDLSGIVMYGIDENSHSLIRYDLSSNLNEAVGLIHLAGGTTIAEIQSLGYIPGRLNLYGVWNYLGSEGSKLVKIDMFSGKATPLSQDTGYGNVCGLVAVLAKGESDDAGGDDEHGDDEDHYGDDDDHGDDDHYGDDDDHGDDDHYGDDDDHGDDDHGDDEEDDRDDDGEEHGNQEGGNWWLYGVSNLTDGSSVLVKVDPDTGVGQAVMILSRPYKGLAYCSDDDDGIFYAVSDNMLWKIDPESGSETAVGQDDYFDIQALEFVLGMQVDNEHGDDEGDNEHGDDGDDDDHHDGDDDDHEGDDDEHENHESSSGHGILFGFSDIDNTLLLMNPEDGSASAVKASINLMDLEGIIFLAGEVDPKKSLAKVAFD